MQLMDKNRILRIKKNLGRKFFEFSHEKDIQLIISSLKKLFIIKTSSSKNFESCDITFSRDSAHLAFEL